VNSLAGFTGKERDAESGLDYFGARYFSGAQGRWTSPDWSEKPQPVPYADLKDPQTLNLYSYVRNNPLSKLTPMATMRSGWSTRRQAP
jgi:RHS repeat-associated protein